jgi:DNA-binding GntR family transcriptional regulator
MLLRDSVYKVIRRAILNCELAPGQELREQLLAERYRVSRSPVRDALLRLESESFVTVQPRQGYLVNAISIADAEAMLGLCLVITPACAARAARAGVVLAQSLDRFRAGPDSMDDEEAFLDYDLAFHCALADMCGNFRLRAVEYALAAQLYRVSRANFRYLRSAMCQAVRDHNAIISAIQDRDPETASSLAHHHAESAHSRIMAALRKDFRTQQQPVEAAPSWPEQEHAERNIRPPKDTLSARNPNDTLSARSPQDALFARSPKDALSARSPKDALSARSPQDALFARRA